MHIYYTILQSTGIAVGTSISIILYSNIAAYGYNNIPIKKPYCYMSIDICIVQIANRLSIIIYTTHIGTI